MEKKVTKMVVKVDLNCEKCIKKIKKVFSKIPQVENQTYDEKANKVTITVVCCSPEKIKEKICCKGGKSIKGIEIKVPKRVTFIEEAKIRFFEPDDDIRPAEKPEQKGDAKISVDDPGTTNDTEPSTKAPVILPPKARERHPKTLTFSVAGARAPQETEPVLVYSPLVQPSIHQTQGYGGYGHCSPYCWGQSEQAIMDCYDGYGRKPVYDSLGSGYNDKDYNAGGSSSSSSSSSSYYDYLSDENHPTCIIM